MTDVSQSFAFPSRLAGLLRLVVTPCAATMNVLLDRAGTGAVRRQHRQNLLKIDDRMLADMGVSRADVAEELRMTR